MAAQVQVATLKRGESAFKTCAVSGLVTGVAAGDATNGHIWAFRFSPAVAGSPTNPLPKFAQITRLRARAFTVAGYTAAQEVGIDLSILRAYTVAHSGGTALTLTGNNGRKATYQNVAGPGSLVQPCGSTIRVATTAQLTAGTHTFDAQPILSGAFSELAAAATTPKGAYELYLSTEDLDKYPISLATGEGLCIRNTVAQGAGGTMRLTVEIDWLELARIA